MWTFRDVRSAGTPNAWPRKEPSCSPPCQTRDGCCLIQADVFLYLSKPILCPGFGLPLLGCLNGKGQAQTEDGKPDKALLRQMEDVYAAVPVRLPETNRQVQKLYQEWLDGMDSMKVQESLHTKYSTEKPAANNLDIKW